MTFNLIATMNLKSFLIIFICLSFISSFGQYFSYDEFNKINDLYLTEQFTPFGNKISNAGFLLEKQTNDYELNNIKYRAEFTFNKKTKSPDPDFVAFDNESFWIFKIEEHELYKDVEIRFRIYASNASEIFDQLYYKWEKEFGKSNELIGDCKAVKCMWFIDRSENYARNIPNNSVRELGNKFYCLVDYTKLLSGEVISGSLNYCISKYPLGESIDEYFKHVELAKTQGLVSVPIISDGKISRIAISIGGKTLNYIIDSGASEMGINKSTEKYLKEIGVIRNTDYLPDGNYKLADGSIKQYKRVIVNAVKIGSISVESVAANIVNDNEPLLLGKSFLNRFTYWKINNESQKLELKR